MLCETNAGDQVKTRSCVNCYAPPGVSHDTQVSQELCTSCIGISKIANLTLLAIYPWCSPIYTL